MKGIHCLLSSIYSMIPVQKQVHRNERKADKGLHFFSTFGFCRVRFSCKMQQQTYELLAEECKHLGCKWHKNLSYSQNKSHSIHVLIFCCENEQRVFVQSRDNVCCWPLFDNAGTNMDEGIQYIYI